MSNEWFLNFLLQTTECHVHHSHIMNTSYGIVSLGMLLESCVRVKFSQGMIWGENMDAAASYQC